MATITDLIVLEPQFDILELGRAGNKIKSDNGIHKMATNVQGSRRAS